MIVVMDVSAKKRRLGNRESLSSSFNEQSENPALLGNGPGATSAMVKATEETNKKDYIKAVLPAFSEVSNQNVVEKVDDEDYISSNNNTDTR